MDEKRLIEQAALTGHAVMVTRTVSRDELREIMAKPLCLSCRWHTYRSAKVGQQRQEWPACGKEIAGFPNMRECRDFEREPGSDDE